MRSQTPVMSRRNGGHASASATCLALLILLVSMPASAAPPPDSEDAPSGSTTVIEGWIVDPTGNPVEGASVLVAPARAPKQNPTRSPIEKALLEDGTGGDDSKPNEGADASASSGDSGVVEVLSGADGRFRLEVSGSSPFTLRAELRGRGVARLDKLDGGEAGAVVLDPGVTLGGRVMDRMLGKPVAGAEVTAWVRLPGAVASGEYRDRFRYVTTTDDEGWFRFDHVESTDYRIEAAAAGYANESLGSYLPEQAGGTGEPAWVYLVAGRDVSGTVVDPDGAPVSGARVSLMPDESSRRLTPNLAWMKAHVGSSQTDESGSFAFRGVPEAEAYRVDVRHPDFAPATMTGVRPSGEGGPAPRVVLERGTSLTARLVVGDDPFRGKIRGRVSYSDPSPARVRVVSLDDDRVTLEDGALTVERLPVGTVDLRLEPVGYVPVSRQGIELSSGRPAELGEIALEAGHRVVGKVLDPDGEPVSGATVRAFAFGGAGRAVRLSAETEDDGTFVIGGLEDPERALQLSVTAEGFARAKQGEVKPGPDPVVIRMQPAGILRGRVLAGDPPRPLERFTVEPHGKALQMVEMPGVAAGMFGGSRYPFHDPEGVFELKTLPEGTYGIKVEASGLIPYQQEKIEVGSGETTDVGDIVLETGVTIHGIVTDAASTRPVGGATVKLEKPALFDFSALLGRDDGTAKITAPDGSFTISGLPPGRHTLRVQHDAYSPRSVDVEIAEGIPPAEVTVTLTAGGAIEGTVRTNDGALMPGGFVMVTRGFAPDPNGMITSDENGHYRVDRLAPGTYRVMAMGIPGEGGGDPAAMMAQMKMQTAEVVDGETTIVNLPPDSGGVIVTGVVRQGARPTESRMFWVKSSAGGAAADDFAVASSDESGAYEARLSSSGTYQVTVQRVGGKDDNPGIGSMTASVEVEVPEDTQQLSHDIVIPDAVLSGTVLDGDTGQPLAGASVAAVKADEEDDALASRAASMATTDADGRYELLGLGEGSYRISMVKDGYGAEVIGPVDLDDDTREEGVNAALFPASGCTVRVVDEGGRPVEGALVAVLSIPGAFSGGLSTQTGPDGEARLTSLGDGTYEIGVVAGGLAPAIESGVMVGGDEKTVVEITLRRGASLTVAVVDDEDRPVSDAGVRVRQENGTDLTPLLQLITVLRGRGLVTDSSGLLVIPNLEPGRYEIEVVSSRGKTAADKVRVKASGENRVDLDL